MGRSSFLLLPFAKNTATRIFIDMDGTLCEFRHSAKLSDLYEEGYFIGLAPNLNIIKAAELLLNDPRFEVFILSSVLSDSAYALKEKNEWLDRYLPGVDALHRIFPPCGEPKAAYIPGGVCETDILIDDYGVNLASWDARAVKVSKDRQDKDYEEKKHKHVISPECEVNAVVRKILEVKNYG